MLKSVSNANTLASLGVGRARLLPSRGRQTILAIKTSGTKKSWRPIPQRQYTVRQNLGDLCVLAVIK